VIVRQPDGREYTASMVDVLDTLGRSSLEQGGGADSKVLTMCRRRSSDHHFFDKRAEFSFRTESW
jgi:hypothetical protein